MNNKRNYSSSQIGNNLKKARKNYQNSSGIEKLTLNKVCSITGIHATQIAHYESGRRIPSLLIFKELCDLYKVNPSDMLEIDNDFDE